MKLIKYRDTGMHTYTYFYVNSEDRTVSPFFDSEKEAEEWLIAESSKIMSDKGYELGTHEEQAEFAKKRGDPWDEFKMSKDIC